jgi:hypothetical protein
VRIRSATLEHHERYAEGRSFGLKNYSNILSLPYPSKIAHDMKLDVTGATQSLERDLLHLNLAENKIMHPVIVSSITGGDKKSHLPLSSIDEILNTNLSTLDKN